MLEGYTSPSTLIILLSVGAILCLAAVIWILGSKSRFFYATTHEWVGKLGYTHDWFTTDDIVWLDEQFKWDHYMMAGFMPRRSDEDSSYIYPLEQQEAMIECIKELLQKKLEEGVWHYE